MGKTYMNITLRVIIDTDLTSVDDIVENLDISVVPNTENVEVYDTEVENFNITDVKCSNLFFSMLILGTIRNWWSPFFLFVRIAVPPWAVVRMTG